MLSLDQQTRLKAKAIYERLAPNIIDILKGVDLGFTDLRYFNRGPKPYENINVLFLDIAQDESYKQVLKCADLLIREFIK